ncbi:hypothetical protein F5Y07DRAFT_404221 [Xylaria sp. FL0933]|nr:hypothetical protein F5Y07DRAFT_404221 [Xylaria sp. FL0933]
MTHPSLYTHPIANTNTSTSNTITITITITTIIISSSIIIITTTTTITTITTIAIMSFVPSSADLQSYRDGQSVGRLFSLTRLPRSAKQERIENAIRNIIRGIPRSTGDVMVYWQTLEQTTPTRRHHGWCHLLCSTTELKNRVKHLVNNVEIVPRSNLKSVCRRVNIAIDNFARITRLEGEPAGASTQPQHTQHPPPPPQPQPQQPQLVQANDLIQRLDAAINVNEDLANAMLPLGEIRGVGQRNVELLREATRLIASLSETVREATQDNIKQEDDDDDDDIKIKVEDSVY